MLTTDLDTPRPQAVATGSSTARNIAAKTQRLRQLPISPALRAQQAVALRKRIAPLIEGQLEIHLTDNRTVMLSVKRDIRHRRFSARMHHMFIHAPTSIIEALSRYIEHNDPEASSELGQFIENNDGHVMPHPEEESSSPNNRSPQSPTIRTTGKVYDLAELFNTLNRRYFGGKIASTITWGKNPAAGRQRRSIRLGSYSVEENLIRIHPGLDQRWVPATYVAWVVYHEMLHAVHPAVIKNGRRTFHTPEFMADEKRFEGYELAHKWERQNIASLLSV